MNSQSFYIVFSNIYIIKGGCEMAKLTAWLVTLVGLLLVLALIFGFGMWVNWVIAIAVLIVGLGKLMRNYKKTSKKRK